MGPVREFAFDRSPFDFHGRRRIVFEYQVPDTDFGDLPFLWNVKGNAVPGDLFPFTEVQNDPSLLSPDPLPSNSDAAVFHDD